MKTISGGDFDLLDMNMKFLGEGTQKVLIACPLAKNNDPSRRSRASSPPCKRDSLRWPPGDGDLCGDGDVRGRSAGFAADGCQAMVTWCSPLRGFGRRFALGQRAAEKGIELSVELLHFCFRPQALATVP